MDTNQWQKAQKLLNEETLKEISSAQPYQQDNNEDKGQEKKEVNTLAKELAQNDSSVQNNDEKHQEGEEAPVSPFPDLEDARLFDLLAADPWTDKFVKTLEPYLNKTDLSKAKIFLTTLQDNGFSFDHYHCIEKDGKNYGNITLILYNLFGNESKDKRFYILFNEFKKKLEELNISLKSCNHSMKRNVPGYPVNIDFLAFLKEQKAKKAKKENQPSR